MRSSGIQGEKGYSAWGDLARALAERRAKPIPRRPMKLMKTTKANVFKIKK